MWTSTLELDPAHVIPTKILGRFWRGVYFSSIAPLQVQNLPRQPLPAANWVRVRNVLAGICGSDLRLIFVGRDFGIAPAAIPSHGHSYPGHEVVGEVIEVGDEVKTLSVGDRVVLKNGPNCITAGIQPVCRSCTAGNYGLCERAQLPGPQPFGGGWSEEMLLHEQQLFRVPPDISDMQAVLLEPAAVAVHAVLRHLPQAGDRVLIIGAGTIGLLILQVIRTLAPEAEVSVLARHAFQVEQAARLGAQIIYPQDSYKEVQRITGGQLYQGMFGNQMLLGGYDVIYDTVGSKRTAHDSLRWACAGATVVMVGLSLHRMQIDLTPIWYQEVSLIGTLGQGMETWPLGTGEKTATFAITTELIQQKRLHPEKLITHRFALSDYRNALLTAINKRHNRAIKVVFDYSKQPPSVVPNVRAAARRRQRAIDPAPALYTDLHPSQPLTPDDEAMFPQVVTPIAPPSRPTPPPSTPVLPVPPANYESVWGGRFTPEDAPDDQTIVVSTSRFARHYTEPPLVEHVQSDESQQDDQDQALPEDDTTKTEVVLPPQLPQEAVDADALDQANVEHTVHEEDTFIAPAISFENDDALERAMPPEAGVMDAEVPFTALPLTHGDEVDSTPSPQSPMVADADAVSEVNESGEDVPSAIIFEEDTEGQSSIPPWLAALHTEGSFMALPDDNEVAHESQPSSTPVASLPLTAEDSDDATNTVAVSPPKRLRSKRKTDMLTAKNTQEYGQALSSPLANAGALPVPIEENQSIVTNTSADTLEGIGKTLGYEEHDDNQ